MPIGITTDLVDGDAIVSFDDPALRGPALAELSTLGLLHAVKVDTGGPRRRYRMSEATARAVGLIDVPAKTPKAKTTAKSKTTTKAPAAAPSGAAAPADWV